VWYASGLVTRPRPRARISTLPRPHQRPAGLAVGLAVGVTIVAACATGAGNVKYPPRRPGCSLQVFTTAAPALPVWDDIGVAEVGCHLDESEVACLHRLRAEACRMGGDILYNVPKRAARPGEREMMMRAQVAHTRPEPPAKTEDAPARSNEPVIPLAAPAPPTPTPAADAGVAADAGAPTH
jgi:hypothetical protein